MECSVHEESSTEIGLANDGDAGAGFDVLGEELGKNDLFGEELGADGDARLWRFVTSGKEVEEVKEGKDGEDAKVGELRLVAAISRGRTWVRRTASV